MRDPVTDVMISLLRPDIEETVLILLTAQQYEQVSVGVAESS